MRIALDMMGGDYAPKESCLGVLSFLSKFDDCQLFLLGNKSAIEDGLGAMSSKVTIVETENEIGMDEHPIRAMKEKPTSALVTGFGMLSQGKVDAFMSAGNTGVMLVGASHIIKLLDGVLRPSMPTPVPQINGDYSIMLDIGINADCKPEYLSQFASMGTFYAKEILALETPSVGLLNIGEEEGKGNIMAQATYPLLKENKSINFQGNIEGRDIIDNKVDIIITDGFTGNIVLKFAESLYDVLKVKENINDDFLDKFNHRLYAGVPVLGASKPIVVGHGVSNAMSFCGMLELGRKMIMTDMCGKMKGMFSSETPTV